MLTPRLVYLGISWGPKVPLASQGNCLWWFNTFPNKTLSHAIPQGAGRLLEELKCGWARWAMKTYSHAKKMQEAYFSQPSIGLTLEEINLPNHQVEMRLSLEEKYQNWSHSVRSWLSSLGFRLLFAKTEPTSLRFFYQWLMKRHPTLFSAYDMYFTHTHIYIHTYIKT